MAEEKRIIPKARLILTTCERTRKDVLEKIGGDPARTKAVYLGLDTTIFRPPLSPEERAESRKRLGWAENRPKVAFVGSLGDRRKGFDRLFSAWAELCKDPGWDADLVVVGRGAELPQWKARVAELGLSERIDFLGFVPELAEVYRASDAHCLPSRYEGYSLVTQEALACGTPAFVSRASGISDRYPENLEELLIDDPEDVSNLVRRLRNWRARMAEYCAVVAPLSAMLRATTWETMAAKMVEAIESNGA